MNRRSKVLAAILSIAFPLAGMAQSNPQTASVTAPLSATQVRALLKSAHSDAEYKQLGSYYRQEEAKFRAEATAEKAERDRRASVNASLMQKYPRPVDSAQYLYESYVTSADRAALQAQHYEQLAAGQTQPDRQFASGPQGKS